MISAVLQFIPVTLLGALCYSISNLFLKVHLSLSTMTWQFTPLQKRRLARPSLGPDGLPRTSTLTATFTAWSHYPRVFPLWRYQTWLRVFKASRCWPWGLTRSTTSLWLVTSPPSHQAQPGPASPAAPRGRAEAALFFPLLVIRKEDSTMKSKRWVRRKLEKVWVRWYIPKSNKRGRLKDGFLSQVLLC